MATQVPYKIYKYKSGQPAYDFLPDLNMTNSAYARTQLQEVGEDEFRTAVNANKSYYDSQFLRSTTPGVKEFYEGLMSGQAAANLPASHVIDDQGRFMQQAALDNENKNKAAEAAGTMKNIGTASAPLYVPTGSAGDLNSQGVSYQQQLATPSVQQQIQNQNLQPMAPNTPTTNMTQLQPGQVQGVLPNGQTATFTSPEVMAQYGAKPITPTVPVSASGVGAGNSSNNLSSTPVTGLDIQSQMNQNQQIQQQLIKGIQPTARETEISNLLASLKTGELQGVTRIEGQAIPTPLIGKQSQKLHEDIAFQAAPLLQELGVLSTNRENAQKALEMALNFGSSNLQLQIQMQQAAKQEAQAAKEFSLQSGVSTPYYVVAGTVYNTTTGQAYTSETDFKKQTGMEIGTAGSKGLVQNVDTNFLQEKSMVANLAGSYFDAGIQLTDSLAIAQAKARQSALYADKVRAPEGTTKKVLQAQVVPAAIAELTSSSGTDGYASPNTYLKLRGDWAAARLGSSAEFDAIFAPYLSSTERNRLLKTYKETSGEDTSAINALLGIDG